MLKTSAQARQSAARATSKGAPSDEYEARARRGSSLPANPTTVTDTASPRASMWSSSASGTGPVASRHSRTATTVRTLIAVTALRLAFVGQHAYFGYTSLQAEADSVTPRFFDFRHGADFAPVRAALRDYEPHVVFVWRPEIIPPGGLEGLDA